MGLSLGNPPDGWQDRIQEKTRRLLASAVDRAEIQLREGEPLQASVPIPVYRLSTEEVGQDGLGGRREVVGWRSLLFSEERPETGPVAAVRFEERDDELQVTGVQVGRALEPLIQALDGAAAHAEASGKEYGLRLLEVPSLLYGAVLLEGQTPKEDRIFPLSGEANPARRDALTLAQENQSLRPAAERNLEARRA